jgi:hypothetical protein
VKGFRLEGVRFNAGVRYQVSGIRVDSSDPWHVTPGT